MKVFAAVSTLTTVAGYLPTTQGWWDNGHMLVGEVATQLMDPVDVTTIESILSKWDEDFPNTGEITTSAIWMDLIKCTSVSSYCQSPLTPSLTSMSDWHYIDLPLNINGQKWEDKDADLTLFDDNMGGDGMSVIEGAVKSFKTTKSKWAANFFLRNFIHIFGDLHQPLHTVAGISEAFPEGDGGGNSETFVSPCAFSNPHAVWDAAGGLYSLNNWAVNIDDFKPTLKSNATELIALLPNIPDSLNFSQYEDVTYNEFSTALVTNSVLRQVALETYSYADTVVYSGLDLNATSSGKYPCPSASYLALAGEVSQKRIAIGGSRLAVILKHFAAQLRALGLAD
ncbi:Endonuclease 1 [Phytophthora citrophthora]|uniref:Endonuclease 1 n=1 Tax=Phytophthora citrophthora TaxID=4793 RepID=A0AAD9LR82_9STRA|nr:Endonuclease 1 [Phytophthora citrophthora]